MNPGFDFLAGGGEMGALMRAYDWEATALGSPATWPSTLKTTIRLVLSSNHPMFIWWGEDLIQFYNDAYRRTMGPERHPAALAMPGRVCWQEAWDLIGPDIERVMADGTPTWHEDRLVPLTRFGERQDIWWTYGYSPIEDESGILGVLVICNDVTEQHLQRTQLERTKDTLVETMDEAYCLIDMIRDDHDRAVDYAFIEVNKAFALQSGLADSIGKRARELVPDIEQHWIDAYDEVARSGVARRFADHSSAMGRWFNVYAVPIDAPGRHRVAVLFSDITDLKNTEQALRDSEAQAHAAATRAEVDRRRLDALLDAVPVGIVYADQHGGLSLVNAMNRTLWGDHPMPGHQSEYVQWRGWWADRSPRHGQPVALDEWPMSRALRGEQVEGDVIEIEPFGQPGERRILLARAAAIRDDSGAVTGAVAANMDLTLYVSAQRALRASEEKFRTITNAMPQMVWSARPDGRDDYLNQRWCEFTGMSSEEILGTGWAPLIHPDDLAELRASWAHSVATGALFEIEHRVRHRSGDFRWVLNRALPVRDEHGQVTRWMGTVTDVHDQRLAAEELRAANERKDEFLAMLAHELRNPLAPISSAAQILKLPGVDPRRLAQAGDVIARQVKHMVELVDDLLDVSRVTRGLVELQREPVDVKAIVQSAIEQARPLIDKRGHTLSLRLGAAAITVVGDRKRLVQVLVNLLNNAAKYTQEGGTILVCAETLPGAIKLSVQDNGIGIDAALLPSVFELFTQAKRTPDRAQGGLGLGLTLVRSMVNLHGGHVEAHSEGLGKGSRFSVILPTQAIDAGAADAFDAMQAAHALPPLQHALRILIVDDNRDAADSLAVLLSAIGYRVMVEESPGGALRLVETRAFDVCLLDIGLPDMDGYALVRRLKALARTSSAVMIALSGYGQPQDIAASRAAGFAAHLVKPVDIPHLLGLLDGLAESARARERASG